MNNDNCAFCSAQRKVKKLMFAVLGCAVLGVILGELLGRLHSDLGLLVACMGFGGSIMFIWEYYKASKHFEEVLCQQKHDH